VDGKYTPVLGTDKVSLG